ncbi:hypothetical protein [uncultured Endozoicomonas sp.]|uniref:hypothetical protein n=1 Tax=uncultured Endozoicomonas sp. TaxID=432652 RepID=UPI002606F1AA|nr:hypothetical protein [uncultured Endozoicomonas sp.]
MIVIPMAGLSSRFTEAGYKKPKYMLEAKNKTLFEHSVMSFENYFKTEMFLFIALDINNSEQFIDEKCHRLGIVNYKIIILKIPTRGQAETVYMGLKQSGADTEEQLIIFNIDTFRPGFKLPTTFSLQEVDGYLETFIGAGKNWSNVVPVEQASDRVKLTAEKKELSKYCCTGLYVWSRIQKFYEAFEEMIIKKPDELSEGEYYIAPMYNSLIRAGADVRYTIISRESVVFCGIPSEYLEFIKS